MSLDLFLVSDALLLDTGLSSFNTVMYNLIMLVNVRQLFGVNLADCRTFV